jgi:hypothetical protein
MSYEAMVACLSDPSICAKEEQNESTLLDSGLQHSLGARDFRLGTQYMLHSVLAYTNTIQSPDKLETNGILSNYFDAVDLVMKPFRHRRPPQRRRGRRAGAQGCGVRRRHAGARCHRPGRQGDRRRRRLRRRDRPDREGPQGRREGGFRGDAAGGVRQDAADAAAIDVHRRLPDPGQAAPGAAGRRLDGHLLAAVRVGHGRVGRHQRRYGYAFAPGKKTGGKDEVGEDADVFDPGDGLGIIPGMDQLTSVVQVSLDFDGLRGQGVAGRTRRSIGRCRRITSSTSASSTSTPAASPRSPGRGRRSRTRASTSTNCTSASTAGPARTTCTRAGRSTATAASSSCWTTPRRGPRTANGSTTCATCSARRSAAPWGPGAAT